jgi:hypothetical protein
MRIIAQVLLQHSALILLPRLLKNATNSATTNALAAGAHPKPVQLRVTTDPVLVVKKSHATPELRTMGIPTPCQERQQPCAVPRNSAGLLVGVQLPVM